MENGAKRYDVGALAEELEVELGDIVKLFSSYFEEMKGEISEMEEFLNKKDWYMLERIVHNVKGVSANLNIHDVFEEAQKFDDRLKMNLTGNAEVYIHNIVQLVHNAEIEIKAFFEENGLPV